MPGQRGREKVPHFISVVAGTGPRTPYPPFARRYGRAPFPGPSSRSSAAARGPLRGLSSAVLLVSLRLRRQRSGHEPPSRSHRNRRHDTHVSSISSQRIVNTAINTKEGLLREAVLTLSLSELQPHFDKAYATTQAEAQVDGFRKGK
ncbi:MAG: trigger factor, partial [Candidatus Kapaibacterium sp.]